MRNFLWNKKALMIQKCVISAFCPLLELSDGIFRFPFTEEQGNTPDSRKRNDCINDAAENSILTAENPRDDVKTEKSDASPVQCADDG